ncbi:GTP pyrophosphokinase [Chryseobacterium defluvii]|uniref:PpGpp synthetase/RelA/SpoT-type nucleotidyltransferase n=1 Tax=Chryseobacterium defluvii TaxID=160396 RepID=A0A495SA22_9FLAO|nr:hypothetical protein [Chryseobacterium defluvii]RKS96399.1 ppGpp synthetase/RelA/SpoT-type nucleotidyltransferase [Chryseobacterium defluvii]
MHSLAIQFEQNLKKYNDFRLKVEGLIRELLIQNNIGYHKIESRVKNAKRLDEKISRKQKYNDLSDITDLIGVRVITYFEDDVDKIANIIDREFVKDTQNSIDKRILDSDKFGYRSLHEVVTLHEDRKVLTEYKRFKDIKFEIQIRSILQHAWAEIEHDLGYKTESAIPNEFKRSFYRVAALLETADLEFLKIRDGLEKYTKDVGKKIVENPEKVEINAASLKTFIEENELVNKIDLDISKKTGINLNSYYSEDQSMNSRLNFVGITTIKELEDKLIEYNGRISEFAKEFNKIRKKDVVEIDDNENKSYFSKGISLFYLVYVLVSEKNNLDFIEEYSKKFFYNKSKQDIEKHVQDIMNAYSKISKN